MKRLIDFSSRFRILKGGNVSLVVSAIVSSVVITTSASAVDTVISGAETTQQVLGLTDTLTVNEGASITLDTLRPVTVTTDGSFTGTVDNAGTIDATTIEMDGNRNAIGIGTSATDNNGLIVNQSTGILSSDIGAIGIYGNNGALGTIANYGTINAGTNGVYISTNNNGDIINYSSGTINAGTNGVSISTSNYGLISNSGDINAVTAGIFVSSRNFDSIVNTVTGNITVENDAGNAWGIDAGSFNEATGSIENQGNITVSTTTTGAGATGIEVTTNKAGASIINADTGVITVSSEGISGADGIYVGLDNDGTIENQGTIDVSSMTNSSAYGIRTGDNTGSIINSNNITVSASSDFAYGISTNTNQGIMTNDGTLDITGGDEAYGMYTGWNDVDQTITNNNIINVTGDDAYGIFLDFTNNQGLVTNNGDITATADSNAMGIYFSWTDNSGGVENTGNIIANATSAEAYGIYVDGANYGGLAGVLNAISNSGDITVNSTSAGAHGIYANDGGGSIYNSGTITSTVNNELDHSAYSVELIYIDAGIGSVTNNVFGELYGNINVEQASLTNAGLISLPYNANTDTTAAYIRNLTNYGKLQIGLMTDGTTTTYSQLQADNATFEDGSTIDVDVLAASTNVSLLAGTTLADVVSASTALTINGTLNITDNSALLNFEYVEDGETIDLNVVQGQTVAQAVSSTYESNTISGGGQSPAVSAATAFDRIQAAGTYGDMTPVFTALNSLSTNEAVAAAVDSTTPQTAGAATAASGQISRGIASIVTQRQNVNMGGTGSGLNSGDEMFTEKNFWFKPFGSKGKQNNKDGINGFDLSSYGFGIGVDGEYKANQSLGFAFFYTGANVDVNNVNQESDLDVFTTLVYGNVPVIDEKTKLLYQLGYSWQKTDSQRVVFTGDTAKADFTANVASFDLKLARDYKINDKLMLQPLLETTYRHFKTPAYSETGAGALNLTTNSSTGTELIAGVGTIAYYKLDQESKVIGNVNIGYDLHDKQQSVSSSFQGASGVNFTTNGIDNGRWSYDVGFGYERDIDENSNINFSYNRTGEGSDFSNNTISAKYVLKF